MHGRLLFALGILSLAAGIVVLQPVPIRAVQLQQTITIQGVVVKAGTAEPLSDVQLSLANPAALRGQNAQNLQNIVDQARAAGVTLPTALLNGLESSRGGAGTQPASVALTTASDRDGHFAFPNLPPGPYTLRAEREGYFGPGIGGAYPTVASINVNLSAGAPSTNLTVTLIPSAAVEGRAVDTEGNPVVNGRVQMLRLNYQNGAALLQNAGNNVQTDDRGKFRVYRLPPGEYYLSVTPAPNRNNLLAAVNRGALPEPKEDIVRTFYPDALEPKDARRITLRGGEELTDMAISVRKMRTITVSGQVLSSVTVPARSGPRGQAIRQSVLLFLVPHDRDSLADQSFSTNGSAAMDGPTTGQFQISGVLPGSYDLFGRLQNSTPDGTGPADPPFYLGRTSLTTGFENLAGIVVPIHAPVEIKGYATVDGSASNVLNSVRIGLQPADSARFTPGLLNSRQVQPGADGSFTITSVYEGDYRFQVNVPVFLGGAGGLRGQRGTPAGGAYVEDVREAGVSVFDNGIHIGSETPQLIEVRVKTDGGAVEGNVLDAKQQPRQGAMVVLVPSTPRRQNLSLYKTSTSDTAGHFVFRGVPPGSYKVFAWENVLNGAYQNSEFLSRYEERGQSINVTPMATSNTTVFLIPPED